MGTAIAINFQPTGGGKAARVYAVTRKGADDKGRRTGRPQGGIRVFSRDLLIEKLH
jgi:hypothetical protein